MKTDLSAIYAMAGDAGVARYNLTAALGEAQQEIARLNGEVTRLTAELAAARPAPRKPRARKPK